VEVRLGFGPRNPILERRQSVYGGILPDQRPRPVADHKSLRSLAHPSCEGDNGSIVAGFAL